MVIDAACSDSERGMRNKDWQEVKESIEAIKQELP